MTDREYLRWKRENDINSLSDLNEWMNKGVSDGHHFVPLHEDRKSHGLMMRYLDEMPVNRESAEEIMDAIRRRDELYAFEDELPELLRTKFLGLLSEEEKETYIDV